MTDNTDNYNLFEALLLNSLACFKDITWESRHLSVPDNLNNYLSAKYS